MQPITYLYSKLSSSIVAMLPAMLILLSISQLKKFIDAKDLTNTLMISVFDLPLLLILIYIIIKQLIPAYKGKIALEINKKGIISYSKNIMIEWSKIKSIEFQSPTTASSSLYITFKFEADYGNNIRLPLGFVKGVGSHIYETATSFFEESLR